MPWTPHVDLPKEPMGLGGLCFMVLLLALLIGIGSAAVMFFGP